MDYTPPPFPPSIHDPNHKNFTVPASSDPPTAHYQYAPHYNAGTAPFPPSTDHHKCFTVAASLDPTTGLYRYAPHYTAGTVPFSTSIQNLHYPYFTAPTPPAQPTGQDYPSSLGYDGQFERILELPRNYLNYKHLYPGGMPFDKVLQRSKVEQIERDRWLKHQKLQEIRSQRPLWEYEEQEAPGYPDLPWPPQIMKGSACRLYELRVKYDVTPGTPYWQAAGARTNEVGLWDINKSSDIKRQYYSQRDALLLQKPIPGTDTYLFPRHCIMRTDCDSVDWRVAEEQLETEIKYCIAGDLRMDKNSRNHMIFLYTEIADYRKKEAEQEVMLEESELHAKHVQDCLEHSEWEFYEMWRDRDELEDERDAARKERDELKRERDRLEADWDFMKRENDALKRKLKKYEQIVQLVNPKNAKDD